MAGFLLISLAFTPAPLAGFGTWFVSTTLNMFFICKGQLPALIHRKVLNGPKLVPAEFCRGSRNVQKVQRTITDIKRQNQGHYSSIEHTFHILWNISKLNYWTMIHMCQMCVQMYTCTIAVIWWMTLSIQSLRCWHCGKYTRNRMGFFGSFRTPSLQELLGLAK